MSQIRKRYRIYYLPQRTSQLDLLKSTRDLQKEQLATLNKGELLKIADELVSFAQSNGMQFPATLKENIRSKLPPVTLVQGLTQLLSKFPEVPDERLALD